MEPIFGFLLYAVLVIVVVVVAYKRGQAGWVYGLACLVLAPILVRLIAGAGGGGVGAAFGAFLIPVAALVVSLSRGTSEQRAVATGEDGDFRKCPFCAESVRREAVKCKHCGSELPPAGA